MKFVVGIKRLIMKYGRSIALTLLLSLIVANNSSGGFGLTSSASAFTVGSSKRLTTELTTLLRERGLVLWATLFCVPEGPIDGSSAGEDDSFPIPRHSTLQVHCTVLY